MALLLRGGSAGLLGDFLAGLLGHGFADFTGNFLASVAWKQSLRFTGLANLSCGDDIWLHCSFEECELIKLLPTPSSECTRN